MPDTVLITGADGFIGSRLVRKLSEEGWAIARFSLADGNIAREPLPDVPATRVVHLAGASFVPDSWRNPEPFYEVNVQGTVRVLEWCRRHGAALTFISSYVYGEPKYLPVDESHPVAAVNPYAHTKLLGEDLCRFYADKFGVPVCIIRPFNIYGPGQRTPWLIPLLVEQALSPDTEVISVADDVPRRDFLHVEDLVELLAATCRRQAQGVYNAASGVSVSIADLVRIITAWTAPKPLVSRGERRPGEILDVRGDISRARSELGWQPAISLEEGLRQIVAAGQAGAGG